MELLEASNYTGLKTSVQTIENSPTDQGFFIVLELFIPLTTHKDCIEAKEKKKQLHVLSCADKTNSFRAGADCGDRAGARTGTSILVITAHRSLGFQIFLVGGIRWLC